MAGRRGVQVGGLALAGGVGYYLYRAGGDPKAAEKRFEADATKISNDVQNKMPGRADEAKKDAQVARADISAKANELAKDVRGEVDRADKNFEKYKVDAEKKLEQGSKEAADKANSAIDKFDKNVTEGASKAKSGISSWFGGSK